MKLLAIPGSIRTGSYNMALLKAMSGLTSNDTTLTVYEGLIDIPIFNPNTADHAIPVAVADLMLKIRAADGVIISTPEYIYGVSGALKNMLDWLVSTGVLISKPVVSTSVSTQALGAVRSHNSLILILHAMNAAVVVDGSLNVSRVNTKFDEQFNLIDDLTKQAIAVSLATLEHAVNSVDKSIIELDT